MDFEQGLEYTNQNEDLYRRNLADFYRDSLGRREKVRELAASDPERYRLEVHALKGIARNLGATELGELAYAHERAAEDPDYVSRHLEQLMQLWDRTLGEIRDYVGEEFLSPTGTKPPTKGPLSPEERNGLLGQCIRFLKAYEESQAAGLLSELLAHELDLKDREAVSSALALAEDFEYDAAVRELMALNGNES